MGRREPEARAVKGAAVNRVARLSVKHSLGGLRCVHEAEGAYLSRVTVDWRAGR